MCFFKKVKIEIYPVENLNMPGDYYLPGETDENYRKRMRRKKTERKEENERKNKGIAIQGKLDI